MLTGSDQYLALLDMEQSPHAGPWLAVPQNQYHELQFLKMVDNVDWFGVSPGLNFVAGPPAEKILVGKDTLLFNAAGKSETTAQTMAAALVKEIWTPAHHQERFTVING
ncbi:hypothetical protein [Bombilactobacillus bombi]|uniref:hypothetical protein n=1 Tax=Bombilactobacillus bombi TaxID=1303590 RepID=UPI002159FF51|nr:hypothetical protein [Bombilactobacillus bombi]